MRRDSTDRPAGRASPVSRGCEVLLCIAALLVLANAVQAHDGHGAPARHRDEIATHIHSEHSADPDGQPLGFFGANLGLKRPAGDTGMRDAARARAERTLQPGAGRTDAIAGGYYAARLGSHPGSWFVQALYQAPLDASEDYRPGRRVTVDVGYRYEYGARTGLVLQANVLYRGRDSGAQAEPADTGGQAVYLSPGLSYSLARSVQMYGLVQKPVYQYVNGVQLTPRYAGVVGLTLRY